jgi:hypothetical protein
VGADFGAEFGFGIAGRHLRKCLIKVTNLRWETIAIQFSDC